MSVLALARLGFAAMPPLVAVTFMLLAVALWLALWPPAPWWRHASECISALVAVIGLLALSEAVLGSGTGLDRWFVRQAVDEVGSGPSSTVSSNTAFNFILLGLTLALVDRTTTRGRPAQLLLVGSSVGVLLPVVGYLYSVSSLYAIGQSIPMAPLSAWLFVLLGIGITFARPSRGLPRLLMDDGVAGATIRRLFPAAILIPLALGWAHGLGQRRGWYDERTGVALMVVAQIVIFGALVVWSARRLGLVDRARADRAAELQAVNASLRDEVSARRIVQSELDDVVRRERAVLRHARDMICSIDAEGRFALVNPACLPILGYDQAELIGRVSLDFIAEEDRPAAIAEAARVMAGAESSQFESRYRHKSGRLVELLWNASWSRQEQLMFCVARDNTDQKRAATRVQESRDYLDRIINAVADSIFVTDRQHRRVLVNDAYCRLVDRDRAHLLHKTEYELFSPAEAAVFSETDELVFATGQEMVREETLTASDGTQRVILTRKRLHVDPFEQAFIVGVIRDVTEDRLREAELEAARDIALESVRLKADFLANMSHEIRTPMNGVIGMTDMLLDTDQSAVQQEYTQAIRSSADALLAIINDILDFSKFEAGRLRFETIDFDLRDVVEATVELFADSAQRKHVELAAFVDADVPTALRGDPGRLRQVLTNLIGNAVKFTGQGEVVVTAHRQGETDREVIVRIEVRDTGIGLSAESAARLFKPFVQADGSTTRRFGGTGLGLAISKQIVELMGGEIRISSALDAGSTFWFTATWAKQPTVIAAPPGIGDVTLTGRRILIVGDNPTLRTILGRQTASWGLITAQAGSEADAMVALREAVAQERPYDLVLVSVGTKAHGGWQLIEAIQHDHSIAGVRVVALTSVRGKGSDDTRLCTGVAACLPKPVRQLQLQACLRAVVAGGMTGTLAAVASPEGRPRERAPDVTTTTPPLTGGRVLIADDVLVNQKIALSQLRKLGYHADAVGTGVEALQALTDQHYDLVLMDCQMPEMDGYAATAAIRQMQGADRHTPIIAMTASALEGDQARCLAAGMDDYLSKPVKPEVLRQVLERWLGVRS